MTSSHPGQSVDGRTNPKDVHHQSRLTLSRSPQPYHRGGEALPQAQGHAGSNKHNPDLANLNAYSLPVISRSESSESGTEADDEKGPLLKGLPAPPLRLRKGLRGNSPAGLTPAASPLPTPPAFVDAREFHFFEPRPRAAKKSAEAGTQASDFEAYKRRKRREILRRCTETILQCGIGTIVWSSAGGTTGLVDWMNELTVFLLLAPFVYVCYPVQLTLRARATGKTWIQSFRQGFHVPSRFDPGPLLYPVVLPVLIAISLFQRSIAFLPAAIVCGLSSIPPVITATPKVPVIGEHIHWCLSILPLNASTLRMFYAAHSKPLSLKLGQGCLLTREELVMVFPLHQALMTVLGYLTTSSLDISELQLLSSALINLFLFAQTPQAEILKSMIWLGGLCIFVFCKNILIWEVTLARIPTWKLLRKRPKGGLVSQVDQAICQFLIRRRTQRMRRFSSASDDSDEDALSPFRKTRRRPKFSLNGRACTAGPGPQHVTPSTSLAGEEALLDPSISSNIPRRRTFTAFESGGDKSQTHGTRKPKPNPNGPSAPFLTLSVEQARVRKYVYAGLAYLIVFATILGPVRLYISQRALSGHEPFGWALGYLFGEVPSFRFWVVSNNLDSWICLPSRDASGVSIAPFGTIESVRQYVLGPATTRLLLCAYCGAILLTGIGAVLRLTSVVEVDTRRKVFHGIMVAMLLPTIFVDPCFIALALSLVLAVFLLLDLFRASQLPPISKPLTTFLAPYVDGRDHRGPIIVSHIFLLIGCAIPLWLSLAAVPRTGQAPWIGWDTAVRELSMVSGVICVGMGDAAASLIGRRYGKTKWCWAGGKSLEGSLAFAIAVTCGLYVSWVWLRLGGWAPWPAGSFSSYRTLARCWIAGMGASLMESTLTAANDNVVVPIGLWLLVRGLDI
ncbi:hypothetical protein A1O1_01553 [Capronia coronata CBS 617.96]|uniref:dolichol kinase n=1 Tax=Capronia coronata CBS 617.96 TaxID=1182541 RepID=W9YU65_9EURO|nr:uncharacterized protein A1O1_01553 [Capronia coronata CBS 617.96]EXJ96427.1 hypothetical protein A1O1_01553 [Capronia coronata CBS 617.96]